MPLGDCSHPLFHGQQFEENQVHRGNQSNRPTSSWITFVRSVIVSRCRSAAAGGSWRR
jgi:hypothetical protein